MAELFANKIPFILKVTSSFFFLCSGLLWKKILANKVNYELIWYRTIFSILFLLIPILISSKTHEYFSFHQLINLGLKEWLYSLLICFFSFFGLYYYTKALQEGRFIVVLPLSSLSSIFAVVSAFLFFSQIPSLTQLLACLLIILGISLHQFDQMKHFKFDKEILLILLFTFFWGVSYTLYLIPIDFLGPVNFTIVLESTVFIASWFLIFKKSKKFLPSKIDRKTLFFCILIGFFVAGGCLFSNISLSEISVAVNVAIALIFEGIVILFGLLHLGEHITFKDWILILCVTLSSILIMVT